MDFVYVMGINISEVIPQFKSLYNAIRFKQTFVQYLFPF